MIKNRTLLLFLFALLIILPLVFIKNYFISKNISEKNDNNITLTQTPKVTITPTQNQSLETGVITATSTTRVIKRNNLEMKIPSNWHYLDCGVNCFFISPRLKEDKTEIIQGFDTNLGEVSFYVVEDNINSLEEAIPTPEKTYIEHSNGEKETIISPVISSTRYLTIGGQKAIAWKEEVKRGQNEGKYEKVYILSKSLKLVLYDLRYEKEFNSMLKSVRFVN